MVMESFTWKWIALCHIYGLITCTSGRGGSHHSSHTGGRHQASHNSGHPEPHNGPQAVGRGGSRQSNPYRAASRPTAPTPHHPIRSPVVTRGISAPRGSFRGFLPGSSPASPVADAIQRNFKWKKRQSPFHVRAPSINPAVKAPSINSRSKAANAALATDTSYSATQSPVRTPVVDGNPAHQDYENARPYDRPQGVQRQYFIRVAHRPAMADRPARSRQAERVIPATAGTQKSTAESVSTEKTTTGTGGQRQKSRESVQ